MYNKLTVHPLERQAVTYAYTYLHDAFTVEDCDRALALCKTYPMHPSSVGGDDNMRLDESIRISNVSFIKPEAENAWLFDKIAEVLANMNDRFYNFNLNGFNSIQFTEYKAEDKGYYNWHVDCFLNQPDPTMQAMRKLSLTLLLNDDFEGGDFQVHCGNQEKSITVERARGTAIVFPSFIGHRVTPITKGTRYSLVVWVYGPKFI